MKILAHLIAACVLQGSAEQDKPEFIDRRVLSSDGRFTALIRRARGQERVDPRLARWEVAVEDRVVGQKIWSRRMAYDGSSEIYLLSDDGLAFVHILPLFSAWRPVLWLYTPEEEPRSIDGNQLGIDEADLERTPRGKLWLAEDPPPNISWRDGELGPLRVLALTDRRGSELALDLDRMVVVPPSFFEPNLLADVLPHLTEKQAEVAGIPRVEGISAPKFAVAGTPLEVTLRGSHPNPGWRLCAFTMEPPPADGPAADWVIVPHSIPPPPGSVLAQVIEPFQVKAEIHGLWPGTYIFRARGADGITRSSARIEVLPVGLLVRVRTTGGFLGVDEQVQVLHRGVWRFSSTRAPELLLDSLDASTVLGIERMLSQLSPERPVKMPTGSDFFEHEILWERDGKWTTYNIHDQTANGNERALVEQLRKLKDS